MGVAAVALVGTAIWGRALLAHFGAHGTANDWDQHWSWYWVARETVARFHQLPLWNPYACGGTPLLGNSQSRIFTPFLLVQLLLGLIPGVQVDILAHLALAGVGGYLLGRSLQLSTWGAAAVGLFYPGSSWYFAHLGEGHGWAMTFAYTPLLLWLFERALSTGRWLFAGLGGAVLALMLHEGGIYPAPHAVLLLGLLGLLRLRRDGLRPVGMLALVGGVALLLAAPKLLPVYDLMKNNPRLVDSRESTGWPMLVHSLFALGQDNAQRPFTDRWYWGYHEYSAYLGPGVALLALAGVALAARRAWPWIVAAALFLSLGLGDFGDDWIATQPHLPLSTWALLHRLPLFASQHVPSRFLVTFVLAAAVLAGFGVDGLRDRWRPIGPGLALGLLGLGAVGQAWVSPANLGHAFDGSEAELPMAPAFQQIWTPTDRLMFTVASSNRGAVHCYEYSALAPAVKAANRPGYQGEVYLEGPGTVEPERWSPNRLGFHVVPPPAPLRVNQNADPGWTLASGAGEMAPGERLVTVDVAAGDQRLELAYTSGSLKLGLLLAAVGLAVLVGLGWRDRRVQPARELS
jgi:hypothetical protein